MNTDNLPTKETDILISKLSHEIRNPLSLIHSEIQLISSSHPEVQQFEGWDNLTENLDYVRELLDNVSNYSNAFHLVMQETSLTPFLEQVLASAKTTLDYLGIRFTTHVSPDLPIVLLDPLRIRQALLNLLRNAQESITHSHGQITVRAFTTDKKVCISIEDNGCGMAPEQLKKIFEPFVTYKDNGTGLGLSITRQIIQAHGGELTVSSTLHQGSVFRIFLG